MSHRFSTSIPILFFLAGCASVSMEPEPARAPAAYAGDSLADTFDEMATAADEADREAAKDATAGKSGTVDPIGDGSPVDWRKSPISLFCRENFRIGVADYALDVSDEELRDRLAKGTFDFEDVPPWQATLYPDERILKLNHERKYFLIGGDGGGGFDPKYSIDTILAMISSGRTGESTKVWSTDAQVTAAIRDMEAKRASTKELDQNKDFAQASKAFVVLCGQYDFLNIGACKASLAKIVELMKPVKDVSLFPLVKDVVLDPLYGRAAITLAKIMQNRIETGNVRGAHLLDDAVYAFKAHRLSEADAREHAFRLLALYSTNGANTPSFLEKYIPVSNQGLYYGLGVIGTAIPLLNWRTFPTGHPYAFPAKVHSTCDNMKPYHFWMAAYLARETARAQKNPAAGRQAAYLAEVGYQMRAQTASRDPNRPFTVKTFEPGNNKIRMDLAWGAAGAAYGASTVFDDDGAIYDVDASLKAMLDAAFVFQPVSAKEAEGFWAGAGAKGYARWSLLIRPKEGLLKVRYFPKKKSGIRQRVLRQWNHR